MHLSRLRQDMQIHENMSQDKTPRQETLSLGLLGAKKSNY